MGMVALVRREDLFIDKITASELAHHIKIIDKYIRSPTSSIDVRPPPDGSPQPRSSFSACFWSTLRVQGDRPPRCGAVRGLRWPRSVRTNRRSAVSFLVRGYRVGIGFLGERGGQASTVRLCRSPRTDRQLELPDRDGGPPFDGGTHHGFGLEPTRALPPEPLVVSGRMRPARRASEFE